MAKPDSTSTPGTKPKSRVSAPRVREVLAEARLAIYREPAKDAGKLSFMHSSLAQIGLPRSPQEGRVWTRQNGEIAVVVSAGHVLVAGRLVPQPLPQGPYARLILATRLPIPPTPTTASSVRKRVHACALDLAVNAGKRHLHSSARISRFGRPHYL